jgi:alpha-beta hydrolase superfamily lysophospholipase
LSASTVGPSTAVISIPAPPKTVPTKVAPERRPFAVRETTIQIVDRSRPTVSRGRLISTVRTLTTLVWLPAAAGRWPLVVFAHGFNVGPETYMSLLEAWAAHGYVVAGPRFPLTDPAVSGSNLDESDIDNEPGDIRFVTDALVAPASPLAAKIDPHRVAVAGHSDGAEAALAASLAPAPAAQPRYRAVIAMSVRPLPGPGLMPNPPILVTQGDADTISPAERGLQTWQRAAPPRYLLVLRGGGHLPPLETGSAWLPGVEATTEAFLDAYVAGDGAGSGLATATRTSPLFSLQGRP